MPELKNPRHETFAKLLAKGKTSVEEAYAGAGFRRNRSNAARLNSNDGIQQRVAELRGAAADKVIVEIVDVLSGLLRIANSDLADAYAEDGTLLPIRQIPVHLRLAIAGVEVKEEFEREGNRLVWSGYTKKLKLWDKNKALENLGRYLKMFTDKRELDVGKTLEDLISGSMGEDSKKEKK